MHTISVKGLQWGHPVFATRLGGRPIVIVEEGDHVLILEESCGREYVPEPPMMDPIMCGWNPCSIFPGETIERKLVIISEINRCVPMEGLARYEGITEKEIVVLGMPVRATKTRAQLQTPVRHIEWTPYIARGRGEVFAETPGTEAHYARVDVQEIPFTGHTLSPRAATPSLVSTLQPSTRTPYTFNVRPGADLWIALGDSLTRGVCAEKEEAYPAVLERMIGGEKNITIANAGIPGQTSADLLRVAKEILRFRPTVVFVAIGANDMLTGVPPEELERNLVRIAGILRSDGKTRVILLGIETDNDASPYRGVYRRAAEKAGVEVVPNILEGVWENAAFRCKDGIHFTADGYRRVAENIITALR